MPDVRTQSRIRIIAKPNPMSGNPLPPLHTSSISSAICVRFRFAFTVFVVIKPRKRSKITSSRPSRLQGVFKSHNFAGHFLQDKIHSQLRAFLNEQFLLLWHLQCRQNPPLIILKQYIGDRSVRHCSRHLPVHLSMIVDAPSDRDWRYYRRTEWSRPVEYWTSCVLDWASPYQAPGKISTDFAHA